MTFAQINLPLELREMMRYQRSAGSKSESAFIDRFITPLGAYPDKAGNRILRIGDSPVLWSCHTDTMHRDHGNDLQRIIYKDGLLYLPDKSKSDCLGADDTAGVWIMSEMIKAKIPGLYIFHYGEEVGGIGSSYIATHTPDILTGISMAIAFDRRGYDSVITHQGGRCCSDSFAKSLGDGIGLGMRPDPTGLFTDTANYAHLIPECTNLSVGYEGAHGPSESQDVLFLVKLRDSMLKLNPMTLPISRDPSESEYEYQDWIPEGSTSSRKRGHESMDWMESMVSRHPDVIARLLIDYGISEDELAQIIYDESGVVPF